MGYFCEGEPFWDTELTWTNNTWPQLTGCFQNTALVWGPCAFLIVTAPLHVLRLSHLPRKARPVGTLFLLKQTFSTLMITMNTVELIKAASPLDGFTSATLAPALWIITTLLHMSLVHLERVRSHVRSYLLFTFWVLTSAGALVQFASAIQLQTYASDTLQFTVVSLRYALTCALFLLHCFADVHAEKAKDHNPMFTASIPSILTFSWLDKFVFKGYKTPLQDEDLYSLPSDSTSESIVTRFMAEWNKETSACKRKFERKKSSQTTSSLEEKTRLINKYEAPTISDLTLKPQYKSVSVGDSPKTLQLSGSTPRTDEDAPNILPSLWTVFIKMFWLQTLAAHSGMVFYVATTVIFPMILGLLIDYTSNGELAWHGYVFALALLLNRVVLLLGSLLPYFYTNWLALKAYTAVVGSVFRKTLKLSRDGHTHITAGKLLNLISVDASLIKLMIEGLYWTWVGLALMVCGVTMAYTIVGIAVLAALAVILVLVVLNLFIGRQLKRYQFELLGIKDGRMKVVNELLNGIKVVKLCGWEATFMRKISNLREKELKALLKIGILNSLSSFSWRGMAFWMNFLMLVTFVLLDRQHHLDAETTFVSYNYIVMVMFSINLFSRSFRNLIKATTSVRRLRKLFISDDIDEKNLERDTSDNLSVRIVNGDFSWEKRGPAILTGLELEVHPGELVAVVGPVGCGKSSILSALLGEMHVRRGRANLNSSVAYVPQQAWIRNQTLRKNILFERPLKQGFYQRVLDACALGPDLDTMPAWDHTEIGERGINLSGGQKQRVSLARAIYGEADIYLLDDPLSAMDSHVGKHIFSHVIGPRGLLKGKTRILATHGVQLLPLVDRIVVMSNGTISESGTYEQLIGRQGAFAALLSTYFSQHGDSGNCNRLTHEIEAKQESINDLVLMTSGSGTVDARDVKRLQMMLATQSSLGKEISTDKLLQEISMALSKKKQPSVLLQCQKSSKEKLVADGRLTKDEAAAGNKVTWRIYWSLARGMGYVYTGLIISLMALFHCSFNAANVWLTEWNDDTQLSNFTSHPASSSQRENLNNYYIVTFAAIGLVQTFSSLGFAMLLYIRGVAASRMLHQELLDSVIQAPMLFFDTTPVGRILNRFSQDIDTVDSEIFLGLEYVTEFCLKAVGIFITISVTLPQFIGVCVPVVVILGFLQRLFVRPACQLRRLASKNRSPIYSLFSEVLSGASSIRAYGAQQRFIAKADSRIDQFQKCALASNCLSRWLQVRINALVYIAIISVSVFAIVQRDDLSPGVIGLAISYALRATVELSLLTREYISFETSLVSIERLREYSELQSEAPWVKPKADASVGQDWPQRGEIRFVDFSTRYREGQELVLKEVTCTVKGGEKIGIVGRTGAGKSSMFLALFRLIEPAGGQIIIDGVDVAQIGLHTLRQHLTILPQEPVLFAGSLRMNLDPLDEKSDPELWNALEHAHLKGFVESLDDRLDHVIAEGGENLSIGQRQLVCLARSLLRKSRVLVLDEATAGVDVQTDAWIQQTIRREFRDCTVLTIAHRLHTILDHDRVMVLQAGKILEFDTPARLLANRNSAFFTMAQEAGLARQKQNA